MAGTIEHSLAGESQRWSFDSGPTAGSTYEHTFNDDGTVTWKDANPASKGGAKADQEKKSTPAVSTAYASFDVGDDKHLVSYLSKDSGYTLTVLVDRRSKALHGFASNASEWIPVTGTLR